MYTPPMHSGSTTTPNAVTSWKSSTPWVRRCLAPTVSATGTFRGNNGGRATQPSDFDGTSTRRLESPEPQAVADYEHRRKGHRRPGEHRVQQTSGRERQCRDVVRECPEQVALDR